MVRGDFTHALPAAPAGAGRRRRRGRHHGRGRGRGSGRRHGRGDRRDGGGCGAHNGIHRNCGTRENLPCFPRHILDHSFLRRPASTRKRGPQYPDSETRVAVTRDVALHGQGRTPYAFPAGELFVAPGTAPSLHNLRTGATQVFHAAPGFPAPSGTAAVAGAVAAGLFLAHRRLALVATGSSAGSARARNT
jgi:hypothetical protein